MIRFGDVLKNRSFLLLWLGQVISNFGESLIKMSLIGLVSSKAPGSAIGLAKLFFFIVIPVFIIGPVAGVYVDRWDRKRVMVISDILRGILVLSIPFFILFIESLVPVYIAVFLIFSVTRFFYLSKMAIIPDIVPKDMLLVANTLSDTTRVIGTCIGLVVAGIMVERIGATRGFYINSVTYFISALLISNMVVRKIIHQFREDILRAREAIRHAIRKSVWAEIKDGIKFIVGHKKMKFVIEAFFFLMAGIGSASCVVMVFIQESFGSVTQDLGILFMFLGVGIFIGTMLYGRFGQRLLKEKVTLMCMLFSGIFIALFAVVTKLFPYLWASGATMFIAGLFIGPIIVSLNTIVHESIPQEARGRIFSALEAVINLGFLVFMFVAAFFVEYIGKMWVLVFCGALFSLWSVVSILTRRKSIG